ncbi:MAG: hypothetical protein EB149_04810 [Thaumarchaeota archaeon]|nr:hypothetical protein [Nitrosopumilaceae archaeon]NDB91659.1 hypothetical protein [Nitrososphaeria archaeon]NDF25288.1 hypothetical protein [Nitrososphaerota archaeon]NDF26802.1 hypothetical protein [Nitrosopumilaceae archaeon]NDF47701.1 hypothetical protein [Nitrosopumilaceae archaeon]
MTFDEIEIPKEVRPFMMEQAQETKLGHKNGSNKQFRYGNLHIREYDDRYLVHMDKVNPHDDPLGHLVHDAQEILIGLASGAVGGAKVASYIYKKSSKTKKDKKIAATAGIVSSIAIGYAGYKLAKKAKQVIK